MFNNNNNNNNNNNGGGGGGDDDGYSALDLRSAGRGFDSRPPPCVGQRPWASRSYTAPLIVRPYSDIEM